MVPPLNSTLIYDNFDKFDSPLLKMPDDLGRYSPIEPPQVQQAPLIQEKIENVKLKNNQCCKNINTDYVNNKKANLVMTVHKRQSFMQHKATEPPRNFYYGVSSKNNHNCSNKSSELKTNEILFHIDNETRYVSGITNKTTCNDIIKVLIKNGFLYDNNAKYSSVKGIELRKKTYIKKGKRDGGISRDYTDYVITESWRGIERSYDGKIAILPVWKARNREHSDVRFTLKNHKGMTMSTKTHKSGLFHLIYKYLRKLFQYKKAKSELNKNNLFEKESNTPSELIFVIQPDILYDGEMATNSKIYAETSCNNEKFSKQKALSDKRVRKRSQSLHRMKKQRLKCGMANSSYNQSYLRRRQRDKPIRRSIRRKLAQKTYEVNELYRRESVLTRQLLQKCHQFRTQNEFFTNPEGQLEVSIGKIQHNIENYAKEIIQTENALLELKNEIRQDISLINRLKRMTIEPNDNNNEMLIDGPRNQNIPLNAFCGADAQKKFVDNIYEFCDNNASMLV